MSNWLTKHFPKEAKTDFAYVQNVFKSGHVTFKEEDIEDALRKSKCSKASGVSGIDNQLLKSLEHKHGLIKHLKYVFEELVNHPEDNIERLRELYTFRVVQVPKQNSDIPRPVCV